MELVVENVLHERRDQLMIGGLMQRSLGLDEGNYCDWLYVAFCSTESL